MENDTLQQCQSQLDYRFTDLSILSLALTHSSIAPTRLESNERLEFLGDSVLGLVVCHELYNGPDNLMEGAMTKIKSAVVSRQTCSAIADELGLGELLSLGKGVARSGTVPQSVLAAVLESVIGAIYIDGGLDPARTFILRHVRPYIEQALANEHQSNYKSMLQQHAQRQGGGVPDYVLLDEKGPEHSKCFEVAAVIGGHHFTSAWGKTKKDAEQEAARMALEEMGVLKSEGENI